jgi:PKD repeat protein
VTTPSSPFSIVTEDCSGSTLTASDSCTIQARFAPTAGGSAEGSFDIPSNDPDESTVTVSLSGNGVAGNSPPTANAGGPYTAEEGEAVLLDGSGSTDDGSIVSYEWDIDNNGSYEYSSASPTQSHTYTQTGTYTVRLRVTDDVGETDEATTTANISDSTPNADFTATPTSGGAPLTVNFTNNSTGYDQPLSYEWDFENDGTVDSTAQNPSHIYNAQGTNTVKLTVTDSDSSTNTLIRTNYITVSGCADPPTKIDGTSEYYGTLQAAYAAAQNNDTILMRDEAYTENLVLNEDKSVTLKGGYGCDYATKTGMSILNGNITIDGGTITIEDIVIQ